MVLQYLGSTGTADSDQYYALSSRDLETADKEIDILDLSRNAAHDIGKYLFSDDTGPYKAPTYEKLLINTMNMLNYLVRHDLNGARIEARRLSVLQKYISDHENHGASLSGPGSYLAGFVFEKSGRPQEALRYYDEALQYGDFDSLKEPIRRLAKKASYRSPRIKKLLPETPEAAPESGAAEGTPEKPPDEGSAGATPDEAPAEILVVVNFGRVPAKVAKRVPIGIALTYASGALSPTDRSKANYLAAQGLVTWVNYPTLGRSRGKFERPGFALNGRWQHLEGVVAIDEEAKRTWDDAKGAVIAAAITRMISRVVAGEVARRSTGEGLLGALVSLGTQATLTAVDTPDTRNWSTLPARVAIGRVAVAPGTHWVDLETRGVRKRRKITVSEGDWAVLNLTVLY
jgi:hypothetical protein